MNAVGTYDDGDIADAEVQHVGNLDGIAAGGGQPETQSAGMDDRLAAPTLHLPRQSHSYFHLDQFQYLRMYLHLDSLPQSLPTDSKPLLCSLLVLAGPESPFERKKQHLYLVLWYFV